MSKAHRQETTSIKVEEAETEKKDAPVQYAQIKNYYDAVPKKFRDEERTYDNFRQVQIKIPFRMLLTGATGSGKTNVVINIFDEIREFDKVLIYAKLLDEPLYATWIDRLRDAEKATNASILTASNDLSTLPPVESHDKKSNTLLIIDDMITEEPKKLNEVVKYAIMCRKMNVSLMFLTQDYFAAPIRIRKNCNYFVFNKINGNRDLNTIVKDFDLNVDKKQIKELYDEATREGFPHFFMVDIQTKDPKLRFRSQFTPMKLPAGIEPTAGEVKFIDPKSKSKEVRLKPSVKEEPIKNEHEEKAESSKPKPYRRTKPSKGTIPERLRFASSKTGHPITELRRAAKVMGMTMTQYLAAIEEM